MLYQQQEVNIQTGGTSKYCKKIAHRCQQCDDLFRGTGSAHQCNLKSRTANSKKVPSPCPQCEDRDGEMKITHRSDAKRTIKTRNPRHQPLQQRNVAVGNVNQCDDGEGESMHLQEVNRR
jgi:hypothetical protein